MLSSVENNNCPPSPQTLPAMEFGEVKGQSVFKRKGSLLVKIFLAYLFLTVTNIVIFWLAVGANQMRLIGEKAVLRTQAIAYGIVHSLGDGGPDWTEVYGDPDLRKAKVAGIRSTIAGSLENNTQDEEPDEVSLRVTTAGGDVWYYDEELDENIQPAHHQELLKAVQLKEFKGNNFYATPDIETSSVRVHVPVAMHPQKEVVLTLYFSIASMEKEVYALIRLAGWMVALILLVETFFGFCLYRWLLVPLIKLRKASERLSGGELSTRLELGNHSDEIGQVFFTFNEMSSSLETKTKDLKDTLSNLEDAHGVMQQELDMAQAIQNGILPAEPESELFSISTHYAPLEKVSGDYYDCFKLADGSHAVLIVDASGHGVPAALITVMAKIHFVKAAEEGLGLSDIFADVNKYIHEIIRDTDDYLVAFYVRIYPDLRMEYGGAGVSYAYLQRTDGSLEHLRTRGFMLGALDDLPFPHEVKETRLAEGDRLYLFTDGLVESRNTGDELYSPERMLQFFSDHRHLAIDELKHGLLEDVARFCRGVPRSDDDTLIILEMKEPAVPSAVPLAVYVREARQAVTKRHFEDAKSGYTAALNIDPDYLPAKLGLTLCLIRLGDFDAAMEGLDEVYTATASDPSEPASRYRAEALVLLGYCQAKMDNKEEAIRRLTEAVKLDDRSAIANSLLAIYYAKLNRFDKAATHIGQAEELNPGNNLLSSVKKRIMRRQVPAP